MRVGNYTVQMFNCWLGQPVDGFEMLLLSSLVDSASKSMISRNIPGGLDYIINNYSPEN